MNAVVAALSGAAIAGSVVLLVAWWSLPAELSTDSSTALWMRLRRSAARLGQRRLAVLGVAAAVGVLCYAVTGWLVLIIGMPLCALGIPWLLGDPPTPDIDVLQALERWIRTLAATLPTGRLISDSIRMSADQPPDLLQDPLRRVVWRLDDRWTIDDALRGLADDLATPDADAVILALILAARRGGTGATATLTALSDSVSERLRALREIEAERAKPRIVVRQVTIITLVVLAAALLLGGGFFAPYATPIGQLILTVLVAAYVGALVVLRRMTIPRARPRLLVTS